MLDSPSLTLCEDTSGKTKQYNQFFISHWYYSENNRSREKLMDVCKSWFWTTETKYVTEIITKLCVLWDQLLFQCSSGRGQYHITWNKMRIQELKYSEACLQVVYVYHMTISGKLNSILQGNSIERCLQRSSVWIRSFGLTSVVTQIKPE